MKEQVIIYEDKCIGCGLCVKDCPSKIIAIEEGKAVIKSDKCLKCGHCIAICPKDAVEIKDLDMSDVKSYEDMTMEIEPDQMMDFLKALRTVRKFKDTPVDDEIVKAIIDAGRFTSTATNRQEIRYIVVKNDINALEDMVIPTFKKLKKILGVVGKFVELKYDLSKYKLDRGFVFQNAKVLILVVSKHDVDAALAARSMEMMSRTYGLGGLHVGLFTAVANKSKKIKTRLGLKKKEKVVACLALGYPNVKYQRSVPRRKAEVEWM